ncbi:hypothetical protein OHV08_19715 [Streptomyces canus]|uniref:hypothetical protein n=1 Tax=Streptomyces canus TaxID=58343 RepID=UPI003249E565
MNWFISLVMAIPFVALGTAIVRVFIVLPFYPLAGEAIRLFLQVCGDLENRSVRCSPPMRWPELIR